MLAALSAALLTGFILGLLAGFYAATRQNHRVMKILSQAGKVHATETDSLLEGIKRAFADVTANNLLPEVKEATEASRLALQQQHRQEQDRHTIDFSETQSRLSALQIQLERLLHIQREQDNEQGSRLNSITSVLDFVADQTKSLTKTTDRLSNSLFRIKDRGMWGERLAEDMLQKMGLRQDINYKKQETVCSGSRPDFIIFMPDSRFIVMDVKFPLDNFVKSLESEEEITRRQYEQRFIRDIRQKIKDLAQRNYRLPENGGLDFVIFFLPNERVLSAALEIAPELIDDALQKGIAIVSPTAMFPVLATIRQLNREAVLSRNQASFIREAEKFLKSWQHYCTGFAKVAQKFEQAMQDMRQLEAGSHRNLEKLASRLLETDR